MHRIMLIGALAALLVSTVWVDPAEAG